jgi:maltose O-acetyltransferase
MKKKIALLLYYLITSRIETSDSPIALGARLNRLLVKYIFKECGKDVNIRPRAYFGRGAHISIGNKSMIGRDAFIGSGADITIGNKVLMGPDVMIFAVNHEIRRELPIIDQDFKAGAIIIEDDVWIGARCTILPGVTISKGAVLAAGSVINRNIPRYAIVGGVPAKILKFRS